MTAIHQEIVPNPEHEAQEADMSSQESSCETTKEIFRRDLSPLKDDMPIPVSPPPRSPVSSPPKSPPTITTYTSRIPSKPSGIPSKKPSGKIVSKKESATKKQSNSGIPLRLKSGTTTRSTKSGGSYRYNPPAPIGPTINKNTLEVQFMNNKKRLLQLHAELVDRQRPLHDMYKSLQRTKKQLEEMGKKVVLEDLKITTLKTEDVKSQMDGSGENPVAETAMSIKTSIENILGECVKVCKKCFVERDNVVKMLEDASKSTIEPAEIEAEVQELKKDAEEMEQNMDNVVKETEKKIEEALNIWQKAAKARHISEETQAKIFDLEETIKQQQKAIQDAEDNLHCLTRKFEEKKSTYEKTIVEMQEKYNKLEEELKKEKKNANDHLMKSRNLRTKVAELETKTKEAEEKCYESTHKLRQMQEQMHRREVQWCKEKEDFKKNEQLLQQKFSEKQNQFDTRLKDMEKMHKTTEVQQQNFCRNLETQMEIKEQECLLLEKERDELSEKSRVLEEKVEELRKQMEMKEKEVEELKTQAEELNTKVESLPAIEIKQSENRCFEMLQFQQQVMEKEHTIDQQTDTIKHMQNQLKAHAKLAAALKLEKDNAITYSTKLRDILQEARDELEYKNKTIYKIHEKLVLKEKAFDKLKVQLKEYEEISDQAGDKWAKNRCQICMAKLVDEKSENSSCVEGEVGRCSISSPQYVSESLIGMSVKKVDHLRARLDNLKKMKLPGNSGKNHFNVKCSWSSETKPISTRLRKQIELRGKLYQILQKHADQSCEDFINLLKLTVSNGGKHDELKPSNRDDDEETLRPHRSNLKLSESFSAFSQYLESLPISQIYDRINESGNSDTDEFM